MTYKQKYANNKKLINLYVNSIKYEDLTNIECQNVAMEIARLSHQNNYINKIKVEDFTKDFSIAEIQQNSIINANH